MGGRVVSPSSTLLKKGLHLSALEVDMRVAERRGVSCLESVEENCGWAVSRKPLFGLSGTFEKISVESLLFHHEGKCRS
jgi:hypothetical protein